MLVDILCAAALVLPAVAATSSVFDRSVHMVYALNDGLGIPSITNEQYIEAFEKANVTALVPFFLNVPDPEKYEPMINMVKAKNIIIVPGIGGSPSAGDIDSSKYLQMAYAVKNYTDYVRIENMQGFYDNYTSTGLQNFMDYCKKIGFKHIMMNPWPTAKNGSLVHFNCNECNSAFNAVITKRTSQGTLEPSPDNWHVAINPIVQLRTLVPNIPILINYESPGPQTILSNMEKAKKGSSLLAFNTTVSDITGKYKSYDLHWAPPLTQSYNSIGLGTWDWIANKLKQIAPPA